MQVNVTPTSSWQQNSTVPSLWLEEGHWAQLEHLEFVISKLSNIRTIDFAALEEGAHSTCNSEFKARKAEGPWQYSLGKVRARYFDPAGTQDYLHPGIFWERPPLILKPALFLDRDGIINRDQGYVYRFEDVEWMPGIFELIQCANQLGLGVFVVTNQGGVAYNYYQEDDVVKLHRQMDEVLRAHGAIVDEWIYAPTHADKGTVEYKMESFLRKPYPGMMMDLARRFGVDLLKSVMVGDKVSDQLYLLGPEYMQLAGDYELTKGEVKIYKTLKQIRLRLEEKFS